MPSNSYTRWRTECRANLDRVEAAHAAVHGTGRGRREATRQINHGYTVLLAAEFQGYCRDLHAEAAEVFAADLPVAQRDIVAAALVLNRQLGRGNANPSTLGSDFGRLGLKWWSEVDRVETEGPALRRSLDDLNAWRNAIAHSDFDPDDLGGTIRLMLARVRGWRRTCDRLARAFDVVLADHLERLTGRRPW
ncbi:MAG: hypothetical protein C0501_03235 [Isosphaera sp.]|nr:hypothetical protein [Isosphaera sp.]